MKDKKKKKKDINSYGSAFWLSMTLSSLVVGILGAVTFAFAALRIIYGDVWYMWFVLALAGAGALLLASFCTDLLPYWAKTVREMRLLSARMSGAMSVSQINKYEEREDRRNTDIKDSMTESFSRVGQDIVSLRSQVAENDSKMNEIMKTLQEFKKTTSDADYIKQVEDAMKTMSKKIEKYSDYTNSSIKDLQNQLAISKNTEASVSSSETTANTPPITSPSPSIKKIEVIEEVIEKDEKEEEQDKTKTKIKKPSIISPSKKQEESKKEKKEDLEKEIGPYYVPMSFMDDESTNSASTDTENTNANVNANSNDSTNSSGDVSNSSLVFPPVEDNIAATSKDYDEINKELNIALPSLNDNQPTSDDSESSDDSSSESDGSEDSDSSFDDVQKELNDYFA